MRKRLLTIMLTTTMICINLAGCGSNAVQNEAAAPASSDAVAAANTDQSADDAATTTSAQTDAVANLIAATDGPVDLTLWCSETEGYQNTMKALVDEFKAAYPDVEFNITIGAESEANTKDDVLADVEAAADIYVFADDQLTELVEAGALQEVAATYTYDVKSANSPATIEAASIDGKLYAYPLTASNGYFLFYDSNALTPEDVSSWDNLLAAAAAQGKTVGMEMSGAWYLYSFFAGAGLKMYMNEDGTNYCDWNSTTAKYKGVDVATAIAEIAQNDAFVNCVNEDAQAFALKGDMIADVNGTWATPGFVEAYGDGYAAVKLPTFTVNGEQVQQGSFAGYKFVGVNAYSDNTGWAMLLAEYITSEDAQARIAEATGEGPANMTAASSDTVKALPALAALAEQSEYADLQRVGGAYWDPAAALGQALVEGNYTNLQKLLDDAVDGITQ